MNIYKTIATIVVFPAVILRTALSITSFATIQHAAEGSTYNLIPDSVYGIGCVSKNG